METEYKNGMSTTENTAMGTSRSSSLAGTIVSKKSRKIPPKNSYINKKKGKMKILKYYIVSWYLLYKATLYLCLKNLLEVKFLRLLLTDFRTFIP